MERLWHVHVGMHFVLLEDEQQQGFTQRLPGPAPPRCEQKSLAGKHQIHSNKEQAGKVR
jgi:hypothetical protein